MCNWLMTGRESMTIVELFIHIDVFQVFLIVAVETEFI